MQIYDLLVAMTTNKKSRFGAVGIEQIGQEIRHLGIMYLELVYI